VAKLLLENGAPADARMLQKLTPLHLAVIEGQVDTAKLLVAKGADVNAKDEDGETALTKATAAQHKQLIEILTKLGAK
jgi:ankyrin repeat protein